jgi:hypothetical protein
MTSQSSYKTVAHSFQEFPCQCSKTSCTENTILLYSMTHQKHKYEV